MSKRVGEHITEEPVAVPGGELLPRRATAETPIQGRATDLVDREVETHLLKRARRGDTAAYGDLMQAYQGRLYSLALRILGSHEDAEEVVQDAFIKAYKKLGQFHGDSSFYTWIYRISLNAALNRLSFEKRRGRGKFLDVQDITAEADRKQQQELAEPGPGPRELAERRDLDQLIDGAINELPADLRVVVVLRDVEGLAYETIAESLKLPLGTIKSRLHKGRQKLQEVLRPFLHR